MKLIIFDFSGVCFNNAEDEVVSLFAEENSLDSKEVHDLHDELVANAETEEITFEEVWEQIGKHFHVKVLPQEMLNRMIARARPSEKVLELVRFLQNHKYKTAYFTNLNRAWGQAFEKLFPLDKYFDYGIISYKVKTRKPSLTGFQKIIDHFKVQSSETLFIDDSAKNLAEAKKAGFHTVLFTSYTQLLGELKKFSIETPENTIGHIDLAKLLKVHRYWQGFNGTPALVYMATASGLQAIHKELGYGYTTFVEYFYNKTLYYGYAWDDLLSIRDKLLEEVRKDPVYIRKLNARDKQLLSVHLKVIDAVKNTSLKDLSTKELVGLYKELEESYEASLGISHVVEGFSITCEDVIRSRIKQVAEENARDLKEIFTVLTAPVKPSFLGIVHHKLAKVASKLRNGEDGELELEELEKEYFWIKNSYSGAIKLNKEWFREEAEREMQHANEISDLEESFKKVKEKKRALINELKIDNELILLLSINDFIAELHDRRKEYITLTITYLDACLEEIGKRYNISLDHMRFLAPPEIYNESIMKTRTNEKIAQRKHAVIFFDEKDAFPVFDLQVGEEAEKSIAVIEQQTKTEQVKEIKGNVASHGNATGKVKICKDNKDIASLKEGEILVACMTQPEFVPAMKRAAAIITDEGGITCHAAIVSRELRKPCIIGTKIATRLLKNGMIVEVDADNGVVKIK